MSAEPLAISVKQASNRYSVSEEELLKLVSMRRLPAFPMRQRWMLLRLPADEFFKSASLQQCSRTEQFEFDFTPAIEA